MAGEGGVDEQDSRTWAGPHEAVLRLVRRPLWSGEIRPEHPFLVRCIRGLLSVDARDRALVLAGQAFIALIPLFIVVATLTSSADSEAIGSYLITRFDLVGGAAAAVDGLFARPPGSTSGITVISILMLLVSLNSFARSMRRTFERPWGLPPVGVAGSLDGLLAVASMMVMSASLSWVGASLNDAGPVRWLGAAAFLALAVPGWLVTLYLVLGRRVVRHDLLLGAGYAALVSLAASWSAALWFPQLVARDAGKYGVIGVSFALVSWLIVFSAVLVSVAYVSAEIFRSRGDAGGE